MIKTRVLPILSLIGLTLIGGSIGASRVAELYKYSPRLGEPLIDSDFWKIYGVWHLYLWKDLLPENVILEGLRCALGVA